MDYVFLLMGGLLTIFLGILGEYVGRMLMLLSDMPQYTERETINTGDQSAPIRKSNL